MRLSFGQPCVEGSGHYGWPNLSLIPTSGDGWGWWQVDADTMTASCRWKQSNFKKGGQEMRVLGRQRMTARGRMKC